MRPLALVLACSAASSAFAVPMQLTHQGRLNEAGGAPLTGAHQLSFTVYADSATTVPLWTETLDLSFEGGAYSAVLGAAVDNALDSILFDGSVRYLGLAVDGGPELPQRIALVSVPYAVRASEADHAAQSEHALVADALSAPLSFDDLVDVPVDADSLAELACTDGQVPTWSGSSWACARPVPVAVDVGTLSGTIDIQNLPIGTGPSSVAAGDHAHSFSEITGLLGLDRTLGQLGFDRIDGDLPLSRTTGDLDLGRTTGDLPLSRTTGNVPYARLPVGTVADTVAAGNHTHTAAQVGALPIGGGTLTGALAGTSASFSGAVAVGNTTAACTDANRGALRWTGTLFEGCTLDGWVGLNESGPDGSSAARAAITCRHLHDDRPSLSSGEYWLKPSSAPAFRAWCDMTTDGGGWTQIEYIRGGETEGYNIAYGAVFSSVVRGTPGNGSYKFDNTAWLNHMSELRYSEPASAITSSYESSWSHDFRCALDSNAVNKLRSPGALNQVPAPVVCTNLRTGSVSATAKNLNYQSWSDCWSQPRLWIGNVANAPQYHGDYCVDCVVTWKCTNTTNGVYSPPSSSGSPTGGSTAFWVR